METTNTVICRTGWCERCFKENAPHTGDLAWVIGSEGFKLIEADHIPRWYGYTPFLYENLKTIGKTIKYRRLCCMIGCGMYIENQQVHFKKELWETGLMYLNDWNSLIFYKRDENYKLDTL